MVLRRGGRVCVVGLCLSVRGLLRLLVVVVLMTREEGRSWGAG